MNARIFMLGLGITVGYVLGTRAGRERYDQMKAKATQFWENPRVARARSTVEDYARTQTPIILNKVETVAKATPGFVSDTAKDVAETARNVAESAKESAKEIADRTSSTAKGVAGRVSDTAHDVRENTAKKAAALRERGESAIDRAFTSAGKARDEALASLDDDLDENDDNSAH